MLGYTQSRVVITLLLFSVFLAVCMATPSGYPGQELQNGNQLILIFKILIPLFFQCQMTTRFMKRKGCNCLLKAQMNHMSKLKLLLTFFASTLTVFFKHYREKRAVFRMGKRAMMRFGKRAMMRFGKRSVFRLG